jgi:hypothetical protein
VKKRDDVGDRAPILSRPASIATSALAVPGLACRSAERLPPSLLHHAASPSGLAVCDSRAEYRIARAETTELIDVEWCCIAQAWDLTRTANGGSPWQRGSNENTDRLLRQYLPRGTDLSRYSQAKLTAIAKQLNEGPRRTLLYQTPTDKFAECVAAIS